MVHSGKIRWNVPTRFKFRPHLGSLILPFCKQIIVHILRSPCLIQPHNDISFYAWQKYCLFWILEWVSWWYLHLAQEVVHFLILTSCKIPIIRKELKWLKIKKNCKTSHKNCPKIVPKIVPKIGGKTCQIDYFLHETEYFVNILIVLRENKRGIIFDFWFTSAKTDIRKEKKLRVVHKLGW